MTPATVGLLIAIPLIIWRVYARVRRMVGRQRMSPVRAGITLVIFPAVILLLALAALTHPERLAFLVAGLVGGSLLAVFGLKKTAFEPTPAALYYTPNAHLGIALSLLLVMRIAYRFIEIYMIDPSVPRGAQDFARSPLTLAIFGLLAGYYVAYAIGLLRWRQGVMRARREAEANAPTPQVRIELDDLTRPEVHALLREHLANMYELSPPESVHALDLSKLRSPDVTFWSVWEGETLVGCGALKEMSATEGEIKSMRTPTALRRRGAGRAVLEHILREARGRGYRRLNLETGSQEGFVPARTLYASFGFTECGPFGDYKFDPNSVFMTLDMTKP